MALSTISNLNNPLMHNQTAEAALKEHSVSSKTSKTRLEKAKEPNFLEQFTNKFLKHSENKDLEKVGIEAMEARLGELRQKGLNLRQYPISSVLEDYTSSVKSFLSDLQDNAYEHRSKGDLFERIEVINSKLDELADEFLESQKNELNLLASLGELEGLLVDIFV
jgi:uncharacterized protein